MTESSPQTQPRPLSESGAESSPYGYFGGDASGSDLKKKALHGVGATIFSQAAGFVIYFLATIILARLLEPAEFGVVTMVATLSLVLQNFGVRGFSEATVQSDEISHEKVSTLFWIHLGCNSMLALIFLSLVPVIEWFYGDSRVVAIAMALSCSIVLGAVPTQHAALMTRKLQFYRMAAVGLLVSILSSSLAIVMAYNGFSYWSIVARQIAAPLLSLIGTFLICRWMPGLPRRGTGVWPMFRFGVATYGNYALNYLSRNLDKVLVGWRRGAGALAHYEKAYYLFFFPVTQLSYPLTNVMVATLSRVRDDPEQFRRYYLKALSMTAFVSMPLSALLVVIGKDLMIALLGPQWERAGEILRLFGTGVGVLVVYGTHGWLHLSLGRADRWFRWGALELVITASAFFAGLPFGPGGVAVAYVVCLTLLTLPGLLYGGAPIGLGMASLVWALWPYVTCSLAAGLFSWFLLFALEATSGAYLELGILSRIAVGVVVVAASYLLLVLAFCRKRRPMSETLSLVRRMIPRGRRARVDESGPSQE